MPAAAVIVTAFPPSIGSTGSSYHSAPLSDVSKNTLPCTPDGGAEGEAEGETDALGELDPDGLIDVDPDGLADPDGDEERLTLDDGDTDPDGDVDPDGDAEREAEPDALALSSAA